MIISPRGLEKSNVAFIGFRNTPTYTQRFIDRLFFDYYYFVYTYIDDILVFSDNIEEYLKYLRIVLNILNKARVYISPSKSFAAFLLIQLLGFNIDRIIVIRITNYIKAFRKLSFLNTLGSLEIYLSIVGQLYKGITQFNIKSALL